MRDRWWVRKGREEEMRRRDGRRGVHTWLRCVVAVYTGKQHKEGVTLAEGKRGAAPCNAGTRSRFWIGETPMFSFATSWSFRRNTTHVVRFSHIIGVR